MTLYLVVYTGFLGFLENVIYESFTIQNCLLFLNVTALLGAFYVNISTKVLLKEEKLLLRVYILLFIIGVYLGVTRSGGTILNSIVDGKDILSVGILYYCFVQKGKKATAIFVYKFTFILALYFTLLLILHLVSGFTLPGYGPIDPNDADNVSNGIHIRYPLIIAIHCIIQFKRVITNGIDFKRIVLTVILFIGLFLQARSSIFLSSIFVMGIMFLYIKNTNSSVRRKLYFVLILCVMSPFLYISTGPNISHFISQTVNGGGPAFTRLLIGTSRIVEINDKPLLGSGFAHKNSVLGKKIELGSTSIHNERLSTVDSGYMDLLVRFGFFGSLLILFAFIVFCKESAKRSQQHHVFLLLSSYVLISLTWSVFTYGFGIAFIGFTVLISKGLVEGNNENITIARS